jgi:tellurite resistance protein
MPVAFFAMVLGVAGLANDWRAAGQLWNLPSAPGSALAGLAVAIWVLVTLSYAAKWTWAREAALAEWRHPVQCCYVGLAPTATMVVALAVVPFADAGGRVLFALGAAGQGAFAVWRTGGLWTGSRDPESLTPVLYLPSVAGGFVLATGAGALGHVTVGALAFGAGLLSWLVLESVVLYRLLVQPPLATSLLPTLGIQAAPPVVGCVAYLGLTTGLPDGVALGLLGYGLLQALVLVRLAPRILTQPFAPSYWAFTFGATALALAPMRMVARGADDLGWLAAGLFLVANVVVCGIAISTVALAARGRLLPLPPPAPLALATPIRGSEHPESGQPARSRKTSVGRHQLSRSPAAGSMPQLRSPSAATHGPLSVGVLAPAEAAVRPSNGTPP